MNTFYRPCAAMKGNKRMAQTTAWDPGLLGCVCGCLRTALHCLRPGSSDVHAAYMAGGDGHCVDGIVWFLIDCLLAGWLDSSDGGL
jgi:hypothetical protein